MITADQVRELLHTHVLKAWFPRCHDPTEPGLLAEFTHDWSPVHGKPRLLEFSARQGWAASVLTTLFPEHTAILNEAVRRARYDIDHVFHDPYSGGWKQWSDWHQGASHGAGLHMHGLAYMISFEASRALMFKDTEALDRSLACWQWITGAVGNSAPLRLRVPSLNQGEPEDAWQSLDSIGTPYALFDLNVLGDCFEALTLLQQAWPGSDLLRHLEALRDQLLSLVDRRTGTMHFFFDANENFIPAHHWRIGQTWQFIRRILLAEVVLPIIPGTIDIMKHLVWNTIERAWDHNNGGFFFALPHCLPDFIEDYDLIVRRKSWWVQFEALAALDAVANSTHFDDATRVKASDYSRQTLRFIQEHLLDQDFGGFFDRAPSGDHDNTCLYKGGAWKDASHETLCLNQLLQRLEG